jgi:hypothetical protein
MNALRRKHYKSSIIWLEIVLFMLVLATQWLDEFIDLPHRLFNAAPTPYRIEEYIFESVSVVIVGIIIVLITVVLMKRLERVEEFVRVCSWCKCVFLNDRWVNFEVYLHQQQDLHSTHGICETCLHKMQKEIRKI